MSIATPNISSYGLGGSRDLWVGGFGNEPPPERQFTMQTPRSAAPLIPQRPEQHSSLDVHSM